MIVKKNSLKNLKLLKISNNPLLKSIETEDGEWIDSNPSGAFYNVMNATIASALIDD